MHFDVKELKQKMFLRPTSVFFAFIANNIIQIAQSAYVCNNKEHLTEQLAE